jgi:hypothetical protein
MLTHYKANQEQQSRTIQKLMVTIRKLLSNKLITS